MFASFGEGGILQTGKFDVEFVSCLLAAASLCAADSAGRGQPVPALGASGADGPVVAWLQQALSGKDVAVQCPPYAGAVDGIFGAATSAAVRALQAWAGKTPDGVVGDETWFVWMTPGSAQQLTLEGACGLLRDLQ
ncbi:MAG: peptidoglycan-binding protein [Candidatus Velthaea sp.]